MYGAAIVIGVLLLAYANGANDNVKGLATLYGSGRLSYRQALAWATLTTAAGSVTSVFWAGKLLVRFTGKGLVPDAVVGLPAFAGAVVLAAALTVLLATRLGLPVSTTHALIGALSGAGLLAAGWRQFNGPHLAALFLLPLLVSPLLAAGAVLLAYPLVHRLRLRLGIRESACLCVACQPETQPVVAPAGAALNLQNAPGQGGWKLVVDAPAACERQYFHPLIKLNLNRWLDGAHLVSSGLVSFARGLNDTPKIVALLLAFKAVHLPVSILAVAGAMALGGLLQARRVARTLAFDITRMNPGQGLLANLATSGTVLLASHLGVPVSTTHVSTGSLFGLGALTRRARGRVIRRVVLAWLITLPLAAALGALALALFKQTGM